MTLEPARNPPPGWYPNQQGHPQWWDGTQWGQIAPPTPVLVRARKETGIAYLFFFLLGGFATHRFYLGRTGSAIAFLVLWWLGWALTAVYVGAFLVLAGVIWLIVDLFLIPGMVREANTFR